MLDVGGGHAPAHGAAGGARATTSPCYGSSDRLRRPRAPLDRDRAARASDPATCCAAALPPTARSTSCSPFACCPHVDALARRWSASCAALAAARRARGLPDAAQRERRRRPPLRGEEAASRANTRPFLVFRGRRGRARPSPPPASRRPAREPAVLLPDGAPPRDRQRAPVAARWRAAASRLGLRARAGLAGHPARGAPWLSGGSGSRRGAVGARPVPPLGPEAAQARRDRRRCSGPTEGLRCLDLGSDNGVVSLLLRRGGGSLGLGRPDRRRRWRRSAAGGERRPPRRTGERLPFADAEFDRVVVVDMLEHVPGRARPSSPSWRASRKPGGRLVVNTPHLQATRCCAASATRSARPTRSTATCGPATRRAAARAARRRGFALERAPHLLALLLGAGGHRDQLGRRAPRQEGLGQGHGGHRRRRRKRTASCSAPTRAVYPFVWAVARLDALVPASGYMLIASLRRS